MNQVDSDFAEILILFSTRWRANVAASRARDRMYLVRSVAISDLSEKATPELLAHFDKPVATQSKDADLLVDRCDSSFNESCSLRLYPVAIE